MTVELDDAEIPRSEQEEYQRYRAFWYTLLMRAIQEAAGSVVNKYEDGDELSRAQMAEAARKWLLSRDSHPPEIGGRRMVKDEETGRRRNATWLRRGASCRWILEVLDIDPDAAQAAFLRSGWRTVADKVRQRVDIMGAQST